MFYFFPVTLSSLPSLLGPLLPGFAWAALVCFLLGAPALALASSWSAPGRRRALALLEVALLASTALALATLALANGGGVSLYLHGHGGLLSLSLDPLKLFFATLATAMVTLATLAYGSSALRNPFGGVAQGGEESHSYALFASLLLLLQGTLLLCFLTENLLTFFLTFELSILPLFFAMALASKSPEKFRAKYYLLFFTLLSGVPLLLALLWIQARTGTFSALAAELALARQFSGGTLPLGALLLPFLGLNLPFLVKGAIFPFHGWLPEAHVEAPTEGSMLLSGILLKLGFFGFVKYSLVLFAPLVPFVLGPHLLFFLLGSLPMVGALFLAGDAKRVVAYFSIAHMQLTGAALFAGSATAYWGALYQNFGHAVISAGLFLAVGLLYDQCRCRHLGEISGLATVFPRWSLALLLLALANAGVPGTLGFVPELAIYLGIAEHYFGEALLLLLPGGLGAVRSLLLYSQLALGLAPAFLGAWRPASPAPLTLLRAGDSAGREGFLLTLLALASCLLGLENAILGEGALGGYAFYLLAQG